MAGFALFLKAIGRGALEVFRSLSLLGWMTLVAVLALVLLLATCARHSAREADRLAREAEARARMIEKAAKASEAASRERLTDFKITYHREKELTDAVSSLPDAVPGPRRIALACERLRQQGLRDADLPASCRPAG